MFNRPPFHIWHRLPYRPIAGGGSPHLLAENRSELAGPERDIQIFAKPTTDGPTLDSLARAGDCSGSFQGGTIYMQIQSVGIDLGKATLHLVALGAARKVIARKKFTRQ